MTMTSIQMSIALRSFPCTISFYRARTWRDTTRINGQKKKKKSFECVKIASRRRCTRFVRDNRRKSRGKFRFEKKKKGKEKKENKGARSELARLTGSWRKRSSNRAYPLQVRRTTRKPLDIGRTSKRAKPFQAPFPLPRSVQGSIRRWPSDVYVATCFLFLRSSWRN